MLRSQRLNTCLRNSYALLPLARPNDPTLIASVHANFHPVTTATSSKNTSNKRGPPKRPKPSPCKSHQHSCFSTYVTKYFVLPPGEVEAFLRRHGVQFRCNSTHAIIEECPFCHPTKGEIDNLNRLNVERSSGTFFCHRCKTRGAWYDLKKRYSAGIISPMFPDGGETIPRQTSSTEMTTAETRPEPLPSSHDSFLRNLWKPEDVVARSYLNEKRLLKDEVLRKYGVGCSNFNVITGRDVRTKEQCLTFPMYDGNGKLVRHKIRPVATKSGMRLLPKGGAWGFFGLNTVPAHATSVVLTEGEFDAMSVYQATGRPTISLPNGASSLPIELIPYLERFERIYLWMDEDGPGQTGAETFSRKLGVRRCLSVRGLHVEGKPCKDANDGLQRGIDLEALIQKAEVIQHSGLVKFQDIRDQVLADLNNIQDPNVIRTRSIPRLHELMKGLRPGELTILSGPTGCGKTTLLSQLSLDYCVQNVPTLWGSFEMENARLAGKLLWQYHAVYSKGKGNLVKQFDYWADRFSELPFYFMRYHGSSPVEQVIEAMDFAHYMYDCRHVILDNLQFMSYGQRGGMHQRQFEVMDNAVGQLREFSTRRKVHISLVVHPRKTEDDDKLQIASVYGSAKATQEADNVLILQTTNEGRLLEIKKNRFDGSVGGIPLKFDKKRLMFSQGDSCGAWLGWDSNRTEEDDSKTMETFVDKVANAVKRRDFEVETQEEKVFGTKPIWETETTSEDEGLESMECKQETGDVATVVKRDVYHGGVCEELEKQDSESTLREVTPDDVAVKALALEEETETVAEVVKMDDFEGNVCEDKELEEDFVASVTCEYDDVTIPRQREESGEKGMRNCGKDKNCRVEVRKFTRVMPAVRSSKQERHCQTQDQLEESEESFGGWEGMGNSRDSGLVQQQDS